MPTPDFSKIWASASPLPSYTFTDDEYTEGWDFVGSAPPTKNQFDAWFRYTDERLKWLYDKMMTSLYPVGSVYISFNPTDPSTLFGGTWQRLKDTFLLANGDAYAPNTTGGSATKTISTNNLPSHTHTCSTSGSHRHYSIDGLTTAGFDKQTSGGDISHYDIYYGDDARWHDIWREAVTSTAGSHSHTIGATGSGLPLNVLPPYMTVYMWKRLA